MTSQKIFRIVAASAVLLCTLALFIGAWQLFYDPAFESPGRQTVPPVATESPVRVTPAPEATPHRDPVGDRLGEMTLEEKVGQLFLVRYDEGDAEREMLQYHPGGYVLFARDFKNETPATMQQQLSNLQSKSDTPLLFAVDEEGGEVVRASAYEEFRETPFESPQQLIERGGVEKATEDALDKALFLKNLGLNVNLGPVCDLTTSVDSYMYSRTTGLDASGTADFARNVVSTGQSAGVGAVLKHFPGHGDNGNTHKNSTADQRTLAELKRSDLVPFEAGIEAGAGGVLVGHVTYAALNEETPASLAKETYDLLRRDLGFEGVAITDDLAMSAVGGYNGSEAAVLAVQAGADLLISSDFDRQYEAILEAVTEGEISEERLNESVIRILQWKLNLGLLR